MSRANVHTQPTFQGSRHRRAGKLVCALALALPLFLAQAASAEAQETRGGNLGVGVHTMLLPDSFGPAVIYDAGAFHIEGLFAFADDDETTRFDLGGRFWYHIHSAASADFSLGGGLGVVSIDPAGDGEGTTDIEIDAGAQIRAFLVPNVAVSASLGLAILTGDGDFIAITGNPVGDAGIAYYF